MATSLRDIPGAKARRKLRFRRARSQRIWHPSRGPRTPQLDLSPKPLPLERSRPPRLYPRRKVDTGLILLWVFFFVLVGLGARGAWKATRVDVVSIGITDGMVVTADEAEGLEMTFTFEKRDHIERAELTYDGTSVLEDAEVDGLVMRWRPAEPPEEGEHRLRLSVPRIILDNSVRAWKFTVDATPPAITVPGVLAAVPIDEPVTVTGTVEPQATLLVDGVEISHDDGSFALDYDIPPAAPLQLEAVDRAGNRSAAEVIVPVAHPEMHGVHVSAAAWADAGLRQGVLDMIDAGLIDTVQLDLKDEAGVIGYDSQIPRALEIGAVRPEYDLSEVVAELDGRGIRVVGRIVAFRDPVLADAAWAAGQHDQVVQGPDGQRYAAYGGFTNYIHPDVRQYNIDIALEAVDAGVDDILWDYIRRPDGDPATMVVPGLDRPSTQAVAEFLAESHEVLRARGAYQGASVFGISATRPNTVGQNIPAMARHTDYLAPMIYPSHWVDGEYRVESPIRQPYDISVAALADFLALSSGAGKHLVPWIQDFTLYGVPYGPAEVRAQIDAGRSLGIGSFLLWNPGVRYTSDALVGLTG